MTDARHVFPSRGNSVKHVVNTIKSVIGEEGWFISGSFAHPKIIHYNDIDVYFNTEKAFLEAVTKLDRYKEDHDKKNHKPLINVAGTYTTANAVTYSHLFEFIFHVQLIKRNFGTPQEIFNTFDLNVCKRAILPNFNYVKDKNANKILTICSVNYNTFERAYRYATALYGKKEVFKITSQIIDNYINCSERLESYYNGDTIEAPTNSVLYDKFSIEGVINPKIVSYLKKSASKWAPELLI